MKLHGILFPLLLSLLSFSADAQSPLVCADPGSSVFWQVKGNNSTVYLYGSIHVGEASFYPLHPLIEGAFRDADYIVVEVDIESLDLAKWQAKITKRGMVAPGTSLADVISTPVLDKLEQQLAEMGLPVANFMRFQPWFLSMILAELQASSAGYISQYGIEKYILSEKSSRSKVIELESMQAQLQLLESLNSESLLAYTLLGFDNGKVELQNLVHAWRCGDKATLEKILFEADMLTRVLVPDLAEIEQRMFFSRNVEMAEKISDYLDTGRGEYFVTVGAGHLVGDKSIVDLLQQQKREVNPLRLQ